MTEQVSPLRQRMIEDMTIRNMSVNTQKAYIRAVANFSKHFGKSPDKFTFEDVRKYQLHLVSRGLQAATIIPIICAIRFLYKMLTAARSHLLPPQRPRQSAFLLAAVQGRVPRTEVPRDAPRSSLMKWLRYLRLVPP